MNTIPTNYDEIFQDRVIIITGVSRSGTSILGKILGSMTPAFYLFEPAIMKYMTTNIPREVFQGILLEDYFMPIIQGRAWNLNKGDQSFIGNYLDEFQRAKCQIVLNSRINAIDYISKIKPFFIIKSNEIQPYKKELAHFFPNPLILHIVRNGNNVVSSMVKKGWWTDDFLKGHIEWMSENAPWYIKELDLWQNYSQYTRAACVWRTLVDLLQPNIKYEDLANMPLNINGLSPTELTQKHIRSLSDHKKTEHPNIINEIQQPERDKFIASMERLGY